MAVSPAPVCSAVIWRADMVVTIADIVEAVYLCNADTLMAWAFRRAVGAPPLARPGAVAARVDRYGDVRRLMRQRYGVRM